MSDRKARNDSAEEQVRMMTEALKAKEIVPPENVPLDDKDMQFWHSVIAEFARAEWTAHQLELAAILARAMSDLTDEMVELRKEGSIAYSEKGTPVANPRKTVVQMYSGTILALRRSLALHARGKAGDNRDKARQSAAQKDIEQNNPLANDEDDLLAAPIGNA